MLWQPFGEARVFRFLLRVPREYPQAPKDHMPNSTTQVQHLIAQTAEEVLNDEAYRLYAHLIAAITAFQLGRGLAPPDAEFALWRAAQQKRLDTTIKPIDTFMPRPDRRPTE